MGTLLLFVNTIDDSDGRWQTQYFEDTPRGLREAQVLLREANDVLNNGVQDLNSPLGLFIDRVGPDIYEEVFSSHDIVPDLDDTSHLPIILWANRPE